MGIHRMIVYPLLLCFVASLNLQPNETGKREMRRMIGTKTYWAEIDGENMVFCSHMVLYGKNSEPIPQLTKPQCQKACEIQRSEIDFGSESGATRSSSSSPFRNLIVIASIFICSTFLALLLIYLTTNFVENLF